MQIVLTVAVDHSRKQLFRKFFICLHSLGDTCTWHRNFKTARMVFCIILVAKSQVVISSYAIHDTLLLKIKVSFSIYKGSGM